MQVKNGLDHDIYEFVRLNQHNSEMQDYVASAREFQVALYESVWNGKYKQIDAIAKQKLAETTKKLAQQTSPSEAEILLSRMNIIFAENMKMI